MQNLRGGQNFSFPTLLDSYRELLLMSFMILFNFIFIFNRQLHAYSSITRIQHTCIVPKIRNVVENNPRPDRISNRYLKCTMMLIMKRVTLKWKNSDRYSSFDLIWRIEG